MMQAESDGPGPAFLFPGQGGQHPRMGAGLYSHEPVFTAAMNAFFESPAGHPGAPWADAERVRDGWLAAEPGPDFDDAWCAQPLLFAVGHALAQTVRARGVTPRALLGHSVGELAAAAVGGVFDPAHAGTLLQARSMAMSRTVPGGMIVVAAAVDQVQPYLSASVVVGAINTPRQVVLSGPAAPLAEAAAALRAGGFAVAAARARQAFHSPACDQAAMDFAAGFSGIPLAAPNILIQSTRTGLPVTGEEAVDPNFWAGQLARPVLFWPAFDALLQTGDVVFLEAGPGGSCSAMTRRHPAVRSRRSQVLPLLPATGSDPTESLRILDAAVAAVAAVRSEQPV